MPPFQIHFFLGALRCGEGHFTPFLIQFPFFFFPIFSIFLPLTFIFKFLSHHSIFYNTVCPGSSNPFCIVTYFIKRVTTSWTHSIYPCFIYSGGGESGSGSRQEQGSAGEGGDAGDQPGQTHGDHETKGIVSFFLNRIRRICPSIW